MGKNDFKNSEIFVIFPVSPIEIPNEKGRASNLRSKFEQLASGQSDDRVKEEREKRKREDEELRKYQIEAEKLRQKKLDEEAGEREKLAVETETTSTPKTRPNIGVRLPIAVSDAPPKPVRTSSDLPSPLAAPVPSPPQAVQLPVNHPIQASISQLQRRRQSSTDKEENDDAAEWGDEPTTLSPQSEFIKIDSNNTNIPSESTKKVVAEEPNKGVANYDYVPEEVQTSEISSHNHQQRYEEPPAEVIFFKQIFIDKIFSRNSNPNIKRQRV